MIVIFSQLACHSVVESFQVLDLEGDSYQVIYREIDSLHSPSTMQGDLGDLTVGGIFKTNINDGTLEYSVGKPVRPHFQVHNGVAHPLDRDGLVAFSYYHHLQDSITFLETSDFDFNALTPIKTAVSPVIPDILLSLLPLENAAYAPSAHCFILLSDLLEKEIPLAANKGIVAHELGHAVFHYLTTGGVNTPKLVDPSSSGSDSISSLDEGLADVLGYLVSGRSDFLGDSLDNVDRSLQGDHRAEKVPLLPGEESDDSFLSRYDPYPLGSVYAATIWSIDQQIQSPLRILNWVLESTETFGIRVRDGSIPNSVDMGYQWLNIFVELAIDNNERQMVCESIETHFTSIHVVPEC